MNIKALVWVKFVNSILLTQWGQTADSKVFDIYTKREFIDILNNCELLKANSVCTEVVYSFKQNWQQ